MKLNKFWSLKFHNVTQRGAISAAPLKVVCGVTHMRQQVKEGVATERAHRQGHEEGEQELEAGLFEDGHENDAQQGQQADDGDGHKAPDPDPH